MVPITSLYAALSGLWILVLAANVIGQRFRAGVLFGDGDVAGLKLAVRVHGNAIECIPITLLLMLCLELEHGSPWVLHLCGLLLVVGRVLHAYGLGRTALASPPRAVGIIANFIAMLILAIALILRLILFAPALFMQH